MFNVFIRACSNFFFFQIHNRSSNWSLGLTSGYWIATDCPTGYRFIQLIWQHFYIGLVITAAFAGGKSSTTKYRGQKRPKYTVNS